MKVSDIAKLTLPVNGKPFNKKFRDMLEEAEDKKVFLKIEKENPDLPLRGNYLIYTLGSRPECKVCRAHTAFHSRLGKSWFSTYCGSTVCSNGDADKKNKGAKSLSDVCSHESEVVRNVLSKYKSLPVEKLTERQTREFRTLVESLNGQPREYDLLRLMTVDQRKVWTNLPTDKTRTRLMMATGQIPLYKLCGYCGGPQIKRGFYGDTQYCSSKCATLASAPLRVTKETIAKGIATKGNRYNKFSKEGRAHLKALGVKVSLGLNSPSKSDPTKLSKEVSRESFKRTLMHRYGVTNLSQHPPFRRKQLASGLKTKLYKIGNRKVFLQGYENLALDYLRKFYEDDDLGTEYEGTAPVIDYTHDGKSKRYFPDLFIKSENRIVEVKSIGTIAKNPKTWEAASRKAIAAIDAGYTFNFLVMKPNGERYKMPKDCWLKSYEEIRAILGMKPANLET